MLVRVKSIRKQGSWRAGRFWPGNVWTTAELTDEALKAVQDDPRLKTEEADPQEDISPLPTPELSPAAKAKKAEREAFNARISKNLQVVKKAMLPPEAPKAVKKTSKKVSKKTVKKAPPIIDHTDIHDEDNPDLERIPMASDGPSIDDVLADVLNDVGA